MTTFGEELRRRRLENGMSLEQLANQTRYAPGNWSKVERSLISPPAETTVATASSTVGAPQRYMLDMAAVNRCSLPGDIASSVKSNPGLASVIVPHFAEIRKTIKGKEENHASKSDH